MQFSGIKQLGTLVLTINATFIFCSNDHSVVRAALAGLADLAALGKTLRSDDRCCSYWWTGPVSRAAVTAVRGVSFRRRPIWGLCQCNLAP